MDKYMFKDLRILYVEDESEMVKLVAALLSKNFGEVYTAENGYEGLSLFMDKKPDVVITDLDMPVMNGAEMIKRIREQDSKVPIIVITVFEDEAAKISGHNLLLTKPLIKKELFEGIKALIN